MPSWYDIESLGPGIDRSSHKCAGIEKSERALLDLVETFRAQDFRRGGAEAVVDAAATEGASANASAMIGWERVALVGFSQGGALSLYTGLRQPHKIGGIVSLSAYLPLADAVLAHVTAAAGAKTQLQSPVAFFHGDEDNVVPLSYGQASAAHVRKAGCTSVSFKVVEGMGHSADPEELEEVAAFLAKALPPS